MNNTAFSTADSDFARVCDRCGKLQLGALMAGPGSEAYWHADSSSDNCKPSPVNAKCNARIADERDALKKKVEDAEWDWLPGDGTTWKKLHDNRLSGQHRANKAPNDPT